MIESSVKLRAGPQDSEIGEKKRLLLMFIQFIYWKQIFFMVSLN